MSDLTRKPASVLYTHRTDAALKQIKAALADIAADPGTTNGEKADIFRAHRSRVGVLMGEFLLASDAEPEEKV